MKKFSNRELSQFLQSRDPKDAKLLDKLKIAYRPYICPLGDLLDILPEKAAVFDIGCGNGMFLSLVSKFKYPHLLGGIEISDTLISNAKRVLQENTSISTTLTTFNGKDIPETVSLYNYIFLIDVLHHVPKQDQVTFLQEIYNKMAPGTKLVLKDIDAGQPILTSFNKLHDFVCAGEIGNEMVAETAEQELKKIGFITSSLTKKRMLVYPHYTIICQKP